MNRSRHGGSPSKRKLRAAWRREQALAHARGALWLLAVAGAALILSFAIDRLLVLPGAARAVLLAAATAVLAGAAWRVWWRRLRAWDPVRTALQVERAHPALASLLVSHVELPDGGPDPGSDPGTASESTAAAGASTGLLAALHARAELECAPLDFGRFVDPRVIRPACAAAAGAAVGVLIVAIAAGASFRVFLDRMLDPTSTLGYPTRTHILGTTGSIAVSEGARVLLEARAAGDLPEEGAIELRFPDLPTEPLPARHGGAGEYLGVVPRAARSFEYRFRIGDAVSETSRVEVIPPPRIASSRVKVIFPAYAGLADRVGETLDIEAVEGSEVEWELRCDRPVSAGEILREPGGPLALEIDGTDPRIARGRTGATASFGYSFRWTHGPGFVHEAKVSHALKVLPDAPPRIEILRPEAEEKGTVRKEVEVAFRARDDFGLGEAEIVYSLNDGPEMRRPIGALAGRATDAPVVARWRPRDDIPTLAEGQMLRWRIEVADRRSPVPGVGRSAPLRLSIVSLEEYLRFVSERRSRLFSGLQGVLREEDDGSKNLKTIEDIVR